MARPRDVIENLRLVDEFRHVPGCIVECGLWRGGMSAAIASSLGPERRYFLFDSFEGLPPARDIDGDAAKRWQANVEDPSYHDNCAAPIEYAQRAMALSGAPRFELVAGWFENTAAAWQPPEPIAILRLDGDWYESTITVLRSQFRNLAPAGVAILDDYYAWDGCSRAVHDFLSESKSTARLTQRFGIACLEPRPESGP
jgi:O-methyltransferase